jgi:hypothetical protein
VTEAPSDRVPFRGERKRGRAELDVTGLPLHGRVRVTPLRLPRGWQFEVLAEWHGPPAARSGLPPVPGGVSASDVLLLPELDRARRVARLAVDELRRARVPDLIALDARV